MALPNQIDAMMRDRRRHVRKDVKGEDVQLTAAESLCRLDVTVLLRR
jgi:hypothetical protein